MPVKRRRSKAIVHRITPAAVEAFEAGDYVALHWTLRLKPWETSPLHAVVGETSPHPPGSAGAASWPLAQDLRAKLLIAESRG